MPPKFIASAILLLVAGTSLPVHAAAISYAGADIGLAGDNNDSVDRFRSTSIPKPMDPGGDAVYGTDGYVLYATDAATNTTTGAVSTVDPLSGSGILLAPPPWLTLASNGQNQIARSYGYRLFDNPNLPVGAAVNDIESGGALRSGAAIGTEVSVLNLTVGSGAPAAGFRMGVLIGNTDLYAGTIRLTQTTGGAGTALTNHANTGTPGFYFFDVTGSAPGDVFTLYLTKATGSTGNANVIYGGLTFDTIPEPSLPALISLIVPALAFRRRRR